MEVLGIFAAILTYLTWRNGKWMKAVLSKQTEMISKQTEMISRQNEVLSKQTEMLAEIKNLIVAESQLTRQTIIEVLERVDRTTKEILGKILERVA
jgi:hydroxymethylpyrimidine/phosphomethylpyrimidine kinase